MKGAGLLGPLLAKPEAYLVKIQAQYAVNPWIFVLLLLACAPFFYYSIYRLLRALAREERSRVMVWSTVFLASTILPFVYVLAFGRNLPWWVYGVLVLLVGQGVYSLLRKLRGGSSRRSPRA